MCIFMKCLIVIMLNIMRDINIYRLYVLRVFDLIEMQLYILGKLNCWKDEWMLI